MKQLCIAKRAAILQCLVEGNSAASTSRIVGVAENSVLKVLASAGEACADYQDKHLRSLPCTQLQMDEVWTFVGCRDKNKEKAVNRHPGDVWVWTALCPDTKLLVGWRVGERTGKTAMDFCLDIAKRINRRVQVTTDGLQAYQWAIDQSFGEVDYAQLVKIYGKNQHGKDVVTGTRKEARLGNPNMDRVSTSLIERSNLTLRMSNRRFTRRTNAFSKKMENHIHQQALVSMHYNFCRRHMTLKKTPAQAAGITEKQMSLTELVEMVDAYWQEGEEALFEQAFQLRWTRPRVGLASYRPTPKDQIPVPWYLDPESGGPDPEARKEGVRYADQMG